MSVLHSRSTNEVECILPLRGSQSGSGRIADNLDLPSTREGAIISVGANGLHVVKYSEPILRIGNLSHFVGKILLYGV